MTKLWKSKDTKEDITLFLLFAFHKQSSFGTFPSFMEMFEYWFIYLIPVTLKCCNWLLCQLSSIELMIA